MNKLETALQYAEDVRSGKIPVGKYARLAIDRHFRDLKNAKKKGIVFNERAAQKFLTFFDFLSLSKGDTDGSVFKLEPWQSFIIASVFGWQKVEDGKRRFTEAYIELSKKNGKTTTAAGVGLACFSFDNENGPEVYAAAYTRDQASICFDEAVAMVERSPALSKVVNRLKYNLTIPSTRAKFNAVSHDAKNTEGKNAHCVIFDEYHVHVTDGVKVSLQSGMAARSQPLFFIITTAGDNKQGPCYKYRDICTSILEEKVDIDNIFTIIHGIDDDDDWKDEKTWIKANPNIGVSVKMPFLRGEFKKALLNGRAEVEFKTKHLNMWVDAAVTWIPAETWKRLADPEFEIPYGAECYGGLDLASTSDICSFSLFFPKLKYFKTVHFVPEETAKNAMRSGIDYMDWARDQNIILTPGKTTDYNYVKNAVLAAAEEYDLQFVGYDRWNSSHLVQELNDVLGTRYVKGEPGKPSKYENIMQPFGQGFASMSTPTKEFEKIVTDEEIKHDGNPVTAWMLSNVAIATDPAGNIKADKAESKDKIDGVVAMIIALGEYLAWNWEGKYSDEVAVW